MNLNQFAWAIVSFYRSKSVTPHTKHGVFFEKCMIAISSRDMSEYFDTVLKARQFIKSSVGSTCCISCEVCILGLQS